jgi:(1->4)-alpha-D-glucan 1-alpha-D-glucosylmutase
VVAFCRQVGDTSVLVVVPRLLGTLLNESNLDRPPVGNEIWTDTRIQLSSGAPLRYRNVFTGKVFDSAREIGLSELLAEFPVALYASI